MGIQLSRVNKWFGAGDERTLVLHSLDLQIRDGEFVSIVGPSGCGKSTLLHLLAGLDHPNSGRIEVDGRVVEGPGTDRAMVFQDASLFPWLTVRDNVEFGLRARGMPAAERQEISQRYLRMVHLGRFADLYPKQLSGGMKQRAAIARALALDPRTLLMDEPFAAVDAQTRLVLTNELQEIWLKTHKTVVFVTHNVLEALVLSERVAVMSAKPGQFLTEVRVNAPHPRDAGDPYLVALGEKIMEHLEREIARVAREEMDPDWEFKMVSVPGDPDKLLGDSI